MFDLKVHIRNKDGRIIRTNPYSLKIVNGEQIYTRDGLYYRADGSLDEERNKKNVKAVEVNKLDKVVADAKAEGKHG